jgi:hypothetical protein
LTGLSLATNAVISATDTVLSAFGKLQAQITANLSTLTSHTSNTSNPHATTKAQVGLGNADNTSDANKPVSTATQTALNAKQDTLVSNTNIKTVNSTTLLGSGNIAVQSTLVSGTNIKTINGTTLLGSGDLTISTATPTLAQVTTAGNTTTNAITVGSLNLSNSIGITTVNAFGLNYFIVNALTTGQGITASFAPNGTPTGFAYNFQFGKSSTANANSLLFIGGGGSAVGNIANKHVISTSADGTALGQPLVLRVASSSTSWAVVNDHFTIFPGGNVVIQSGNTSATDAGYRLDVNGTARIQSKLSVGTPTQASAILEITSTTLGFLPPRMTTTQKNAIASPATGLMVYDTTLNLISVYNGTMWI